MRGPQLRQGVIACVLVAVVLGATACTAIGKIRTTVHDLHGNKATIDSFTASLQSGAPKAFAVTYVTTGSSPATVVYAVKPPTGVAFDDSPIGGSGDSTPIHLLANATGEYECSHSTSGAGSTSQWSCTKLNPTDASNENELFNFYTPSHWIGFLRDFSLAAGLAGDKVSTSSMTVNGFAMHCVDFNAPGVPGTSTICSTKQDILGYVKVASDNTSFEIQSYSSSPSASLFELPPEATVTSSSQ